MRKEENLKTGDKGENTGREIKANNNVQAK